MPLAEGVLGAGGGSGAAGTGVGGAGKVGIVMVGIPDELSIPGPNPWCPVHRCILGSAWI